MLIACKERINCEIALDKSATMPSYYSQYQRGPRKYKGDKNGNTGIDALKGGLKTYMKKKKDGEAVVRKSRSSALSDSMKQKLASANNLTRLSSLKECQAILRGDAENLGLRASKDAIDYLFNCPMSTKGLGIAARRLCVQDKRTTIKAKDVENAYETAKLVRGG